MKTRHKHGAFVREDIWREGKWLDLWSVVHFLSGVSLALGIYLFKFGIPASLTIALLLLVAYELWEAMVKIEETRQNRVMDVVVGMASFTPTFLFLAPTLALTPYIVFFASVFVVNCVLSALGWYASQKAEQLEARVRAEYEDQRARMKERRAQRRLLRQQSGLEGIDV